MRLQASAENSRKRAGSAIKEGKRKNGATGRSDIEGKVTRVGASEPGGDRVSIKGRRRGNVRLATASPSAGGHGEWSRRDARDIDGLSREAERSE